MSKLDAAHSVSAVCVYIMSDADSVKDMLSQLCDSNNLSCDTASVYKPDPVSRQVSDSMFVMTIPK